MDRHNQLRARLERGDVAVGAAATTAAPAVVELYGALGLDYAWIDLEHRGPSADDAERLAGLARTAEAADVGLLVRLPEPRPSTVRKALDAGVRSLLVPRVETAAEVRRAVAAAHFSYDGSVGERGVGAVRANGWDAGEDGYAAAEDASVLVGAMVETRAAVENVERILDVPELGFVFVGPADLSQSLGHGGEPGHPDVRAAVDRVLEAAAGAGVPVGGIPADPSDARERVDAGFRMLLVGSETGAARSVLGDWLDEWREGR